LTLLRLVREDAAVDFAAILAVLFTALDVQTRGTNLPADRWIAVQTANLHVVSNAGEAATLQAAQRLEQFVGAVSSLADVSGRADVPVTVVMFKDDASFAPFKPLYRGRPQNVHGYFRRGDDENVIALNLDVSDTEHPLRVIFHEYTHLLTTRPSRRLPAWLEEGLAEVYSTFEARKSRATIGGPIASHVSLLRQAPLIPLRVLSGVDHESPLYAEETRQNLFYAESWAIAHYLMLGDAGSHQRALAEFIAALHAGTDAAPAFASAFHMTFEEMDARVARYVAANRYPSADMAVGPVDLAPAGASRPLPPAEVDCHLGNLLLHTKRSDEAEAYFRRALTLDPSLARADEGLAFLALDRGDIDEAMAHFKAAVAHDTINYLALFTYAGALHQRLLSDAAPMTPSAVAPVAQLLRRTIALRPTFAPACQLLGSLSLETGEELAEGERLLRRAIDLDPSHREWLLTLASIQLRAGAYAAARATAQRLLDFVDTSATLRSEARHIIEEATRLGGGDGTDARRPELTLVVRRSRLTRVVRRPELTLVVRRSRLTIVVRH